MKRVIALFSGIGLAFFAGSLMAEPINLNFEGTEASPAVKWTGGNVSTVERHFRSSGDQALVVTGPAATVEFAAPVMNARFFFVHGGDVAQGTAVAYDAERRVLDMVRSRPASHYGDSRNFVRFNTKQPIAAVTFTGGVVDSFTASVYEPDFFLVEGHSWVNDDAAGDNAAGIFFDYLSTTNTLFMAWFTYSSEEKVSGPDFDGDVGAPDNRWLTATFNVRPGETTVVGTLFASTGGEFNRPRTPFQATEPVGVITLEFIDCSRARVSYELEVPPLSGEFEIIPTEKQVNPAAFDCDPRGALAAAFQPDISQVDADIELSIQAASDGNQVALRFSWDTNKNYFGMVRDLRALNKDGEWSRPIANINPDNPTQTEEDRVALIWSVEGSSRSANLGCFESCHNDMNRMPEATVDARHYVIPGDPSELGTYQSDMWHWRGNRSGPMGYAEDTWVRAHAYGSGAQGRRRDDTGSDGRLRENQGFSTYTVTVGGATRELELPDLVYDPAVNSGFYFLSDGARLITPAFIGNLFNNLTFEKMEALQLQHALILNGPKANALEVASLDQETLNAVAAQALAGGIINVPYLQDDLTGDSDQHDIRSTREFSNGRVSITMFRDLDTGSPNDVNLSDLASRDYHFGVGVHDSNDGGRSHHVSVPISVGPTGNLKPVTVDDVAEVNWRTIPAFNTTVFVPGDMSYQWLNDQFSGHPVTVGRDCASCHSIKGKEHPFFDATGSNCMGCHTSGRRAATVNEYAPLFLDD
ncbi:MAG: hypothetical protein EA370_05970 [Wenzhouxiangella sp.]|nr:MAG: hypothetical protein EA370_05970 [Wenzhouxiangella sp.]